MAVKEALFSLTLPSLFLRFFSFRSVPPPDGARAKSKDTYTKTDPTQPAENTANFTLASGRQALASLFAFKPPPPPNQLIRDKIKHVYQERLEKPYNKCRHAVLKMTSQYLQTERGIGKGDLRQILYPKNYRPEMPNNLADALVTDWQRKGFKGPVRNPSKDKLRKVQDIIDAHTDAKLPVPVYVSHTNGKHVILVTDKIKMKDGRIAYLFIDPATDDPIKSRGMLIQTDEIGNFIKPGNTKKKVRGTANQRYDLLAVYSYIDRFNAVANQNTAVAKLGDVPLRTTH